MEQRIANPQPTAGRSQREKTCAATAPVKNSNTIAPRKPPYSVPSHPLPKGNPLLTSTHSLAFLLVNFINETTWYAHNVFFFIEV